MRRNTVSITASLLPSGLVLAAVALVYAGTISFQFCWDDLSYVIQNPYIRAISWNNISAIFSRNFEGNYAPVHILTYVIEYALWGLDPKGYHLVNVLLHAFNSLFLYFLIRKITDRQDVALFAALLFAVHPVQVENVAWISEQKSLLAMAFFLPAFYLYVLDAETKKLWFYWASVALYGLSLLAKVSTVSLPVLLLLYDFCYGKKIEKKQLINKAPYFLIAGGMGVVSILIQTSNRGMFYFRNDPFVTVLTTLVAVKKYLFSILLTVNLSAYYSLVHTRLSEPVVLLSLSILVSLIVGTVYLLKNKKEAGFWAAWFWAAILPNLNIIPLSVVMADRYLYLPLIGPSVLFSFALFGALKEPLLKRFSGKVRWTYAAAGTIVLLLAITSHARSRIWENNLTLWKDTVTRLEHGIPYTNLGASYLEAGNVEEAKKYFEKSIQVMPDYYLAYQNLGRIYLQERDVFRAEAYFIKVLNLNPNNPFISTALAGIYSDRGDLDLALTNAGEGLKYAPNEPSLLNVKANVLTRKGELKEPLEIYRRLTDLEPRSYAHWFNLGAVLARLGKTEEAENALKHAIDLNGALPNAYRELALLYVKGGNNAQAAEKFERGLAAFQDNSQALRNLSYLYVEHFPEKTDRVIMFAQRSLEHTPGDPNSLGALGWAFSKKGEYGRAAGYYKQALAALPNEPYLIYQTGTNFLKAGEKKIGSAYLDELIRKYPEHEMSRQVKRDTKRK